MEPGSEESKDRIVDSEADAPQSPPVAETVTLEQVLAGQNPRGTYEGPERRAQGMLIADVFPDATVADSKDPEAGRKL